MSPLVLLVVGVVALLPGLSWAETPGAPSPVVTIARLSNRAATAEARTDRFLDGSEHALHRVAFAQWARAFRGVAAGVAVEPTGPLGPENFAPCGELLRLVRSNGALALELGLDHAAGVPKRSDIDLIWTPIRFRLVAGELPQDAEVASFRKAAGEWLAALDRCERLERAERLRLRQVLLHVQGMSQRLGDAKFAARLRQHVAGQTYNGTIGGLAQHVIANELVVVPGSRAQQLLVKLRSEAAKIARGEPAVPAE